MRLQYTKSFLYIPSASFRFEYAEEASSWDVSGEKVQSIKLRIRRKDEHVIPRKSLVKMDEPLDH